MNQYPKWFLALIFPNVIIPIGTMIFYVFGGVTPFGQPDSHVFRFLLYLLMQLFWVLPVCSFFLSLFLWGNTFERAAIGTGVIGLLVSLTSIALLVV